MPPKCKGLKKNECELRADCKVEYNKDKYGVNTKSMKNCLPILKTEVKSTTKDQECKKGDCDVEKLQDALSERSKADDSEEISETDDSEEISETDDSEDDKERVSPCTKIMKLNEYANNKEREKACQENSMCEVIYNKNKSGRAPSMKNCKKKKEIEIKNKRQIDNEKDLKRQLDDEERHEKLEQERQNELKRQEEREKERTRQFEEELKRQDEEKRISDTLNSFKLNTITQNLLRTKLEEAKKETYPNPDLIKRLNDMLNKGKPTSKRGGIANLFDEPDDDNQHDDDNETEILEREQISKMLEDANKNFSKIQEIEKTKGELEKADLDKAMKELDLEESNEDEAQPLKKPKEIKKLDIGIGITDYKKILQNNYEELQNGYMELQDKYDELVKENDDCEKEYEEEERKCKNEMDAAQQECEGRLKSKQNFYEIIFKFEKEENAKLNQQNKILSEERYKLHAKIKNVENSMSEKTSELEENLKNLQAQKEQHDSITQLNADILENLNINEESLQKSKNEQKILEEKTKKMEDNLKANLIETNHLHGEIEKLKRGENQLRMDKKEIIVLMADISNGIKKTEIILQKKENELKGLVEERDKSQTKNKELKKNLLETKNILDTTRDKLTDMEYAKEFEIRKLRDEVAALKREKQIREKPINNGERLLSLEQEFDKIEKKLDEYESKIEQLRKERNESHNELIELQKNQNEAQSKYRTMEHEHYELLEDKNKLQKLLNEKQKDLHEGEKNLKPHMPVIVPHVQSVEINQEMYNTLLNKFHSLQWLLRVLLSFAKKNINPNQKINLTTITQQIVGPQAKAAQDLARLLRREKHTDIIQISSLFQILNTFVVNNQISVPLLEHQEAAVATGLVPRVAVRVDPGAENGAAAVLEIILHAGDTHAVVPTSIVENPIQALVPYINDTQNISLEGIPVGLLHEGFINLKKNITMRKLMELQNLPGNDIPNNVIMIMLNNLPKRVTNLRIDIPATVAAVPLTDPLRSQLVAFQQTQEEISNDREMEIWKLISILFLTYNRAILYLIIAGIRQGDDLRSCQERLRICETNQRYRFTDVTEIPVCPEVPESRLGEHMEERNNLLNMVI